MWLLLPAAAVYCMLGVWLLYTFPKTFTLGEAMIVSQGLTMLFVDVSLQLLPMVSGRGCEVYSMDNREQSLLAVACTVFTDKLTTLFMSNRLV